MKTVMGIVILGLVAATASAGEAFGTLSENGKPVAEGVSVKLDCGGATAAAATDSFGAFSVKTAAAGDCRLTVTYKGSSPSLKVTLYEKPSRYDLVLKQEGGKVTLARK